MIERGSESMSGAEHWSRSPMVCEVWSSDRAAHALGTSGEARPVVVRYRYAALVLKVCLECLAPYMPRFHRHGADLLEGAL